MPRNLSPCFLALRSACCALLLHTAGMAAERVVPRPRTFGGKVLEVRPAQKSFLMNGGASRRYARVRILHGSKTKWLGVSVAGRGLQVGERVQVSAVAEGEAFRALTVHVLDPNARPAGSPVPLAKPSR